MGLKRIRDLYRYYPPIWGSLIEKGESISPGSENRSSAHPFINEQRDSLPYPRESKALYTFIIRGDGYARRSLFKGAGDSSGIEERD